MTSSEGAPAQRDPLETSLLFDVFALNQAVGRYLAHAMRGGPLTPADYATYSAIFELEAGTPSTLAARLGMPLTTLMDHVARLEARGHARRLPSPTDRRSSIVVLTADGLAAHRAANLAFEAAAAAFIAELHGGEGAAKADLARIREAVERAPGTAAATRRSGGRAG